MVHCFSGCDPREVLKTLREIGLLDGESAPRPVPAPEHSSRSRAGLLNRIFEESEPIETGGIVVSYLSHRKIELPNWPSDIREHPSLAVYEGGRPTGQQFPALLAVIRDKESRPTGLHLTFLRKNGSGKADIPTQRKIIGVAEGSTRGGCVRIADPKDGQIGLAEGIETAISASLLTGTPCWAALNAGGLERAILPPEIERVTLFSDRDPPGLKAAALACERFRKEGRQAEILVPDEKGWDFNNILTNKNARSVAN